MNIDSYLEHNALVGIWVTNKASRRGHVLGPGGLFETWNVGLMEEWIWVKTTTKGEPMFDIDDAMRKLEAKRPRLKEQDDEGKAVKKPRFASVP